MEIVFSQQSALKISQNVAWGTKFEDIHVSLPGCDADFDLIREELRIKGYQRRGYFALPSKLKIIVTVRAYFMLTWSRLHLIPHHYTSVL